MRSTFGAARVALGVAWVLQAAAAAQVVSPPASLPSAGSRAQILAIDSSSGVRQMRELDGQIDAMIRSRELRPWKTSPDSLLAGRVHERFDQFHRGVRIWGADVARQSKDGITVSAFGTVYPALDLDVNPTLDVDEARGAAERHVEGGRAYPLAPPELVVLPEQSGGASLAYVVIVHSRTDCLVVFVDAKTGAVLRAYSDRQTQSVVGTGTGVLGDRKKVSASTMSGRYVADDELRPPDRFRTFDLRGDVGTTAEVLYGGRPLYASDMASDADNVWDDPAAVDAHTYAGWTYDYFYKRFNRHGLDDRDYRMLNIVHPIERGDVLKWAGSPDWDDVSTFYLNAFYDPHWGGLMVYGEGLPPDLTYRGQHVNYFAGALDIVAHELTHGITAFSSRLAYAGESGALNESFSDIMGTGAEWFHQTPGSASLGTPDYLIGEDVFTPGGIRSLSDPRAFDQPDHYSRRYTGEGDNGGVHTNSGIGNHAFYLAVEGGVNRTSGLSVHGVGAANREQIEKIFYRAFTALMPSSATFATARATTIQAARDLYGSGSAAERAISEAWSAVGVFPAASLAISFAPSPAIGTTQCQFAIVPCWKFTATVTETGGQGASIESIAAVEYDDNGRQISAHWTFSFAEYFDRCGPGSARIDAFGSACVKWEWNLDRRGSGYVELDITARADDGTRRRFSGVQRLAPVGAPGLTTDSGVSPETSGWRAKPDQR
ncbi:MAG: peptidase M4 family protein [Acidobacteria bacterium]|nr:peptidase M4 family protein [Acidobacteriota bacterium]